MNDPNISYTFLFLSSYGRDYDINQREKIKCLMARLIPFNRQENINLKEEKKGKNKKL